MTKAVNKCYLIIKLIDWDKDKDTTVKSKPPTVKKGKSQSFEDTIYLISGNEPPEKFLYWLKDVTDKLVTKIPNGSTS